MAQEFPGLFAYGCYLPPPNSGQLLNLILQLVSKMKIDAGRGDIAVTQLIPYRSEWNTARGQPGSISVPERVKADGLRQPGSRSQLFKSAVNS